MIANIDIGIMYPMISFILFIIIPNLSIKYRFKNAVTITNEIQYPQPIIYANVLISGLPLTAVQAISNAHITIPAIVMREI